jgi:hypothetical protein
MNCGMMKQTYVQMRCPRPGCDGEIMHTGATTGRYRPKCLHCKKKMRRVPNGRTYTQ